MEWSYLPCCSFSSSPKSLSPSESLRQTCLSQDGGVLMEARPTCSIRPVQVNRAWSALKMHVARKGLEIGLGALPMPVQLSQQQAVQQQGRRVLPKLIQPGQRQPLLRRKLCPSLQVKADTIVDNIKEKEVRRLWGDPNPTEESLALLLPCPPPLLAPLDLQVPQEHSVQRPRALAMTPPALPSLDNRTAGPEAGLASILPKECVSHQSFSATRGRHQTDIEDSSRPRAAAAVTISKMELSQEVRSTLWMHTARKHLEIKLQRLPMVVQQSTEMLHRSLPKLRRAGSLGPRSASLPLLKLKHLIQPHQDTLRQLGTSLACPVASVTPRACPVPVPVYSPVPRQNNSQASLQASTLPSMSCGDAMGTATMGAVLRTPGGMANASAGQASTRSVLFPGFPAMGSKPEPWRGAHLWARCGGFVAPAPGVPQSHRGCCKAEDTTAGGSFHRLTDAVPSVGTTSTQGTAASKPGGAGAGHKGGRWRSSRRQCPGSSESSPGWGAWSQDTSRSTDIQGTRTPVGLPQATPPQAAPLPPVVTPSSSEGTPRQHSLPRQQHCSIPVTRQVCLCHLHPAQDAQGTAEGLSGNTLRSVLEKILQRRRKLAPSTESSASEHSCHAAAGQGQASSSSSSKQTSCPHLQPRAQAGEQPGIPAGQHPAQHILQLQQCDGHNRHRCHPKDTPRDSECLGRARVHPGLLWPGPRVARYGPRA